MEEQILQISSGDNHVLLTINRPKSLNALNARLIEQLHKFFSGGHQDYSPFAAVIITGEGSKAFVAGADITEFNTLDESSGADFARRGQELMFLIERFHRPVIAAVNGFALGGGCELAMACHLRIASENAKFGQPEANLGLIPGYGGTQRLIQLVGKGCALELMLTCEMIDARKALNIGLVNAVTTQEQLLDHVKAVVNTIAEKGPLAIANILTAANAYFDHGLDGYQVEVGQFATLMNSDDFTEGTQAFLEKRKPKFTGR
jgi:enoyl-CoA hydratase